MQLFVDSDCDISRKETESYGATFIPMPYYIGEQEVVPYEDWEEFDGHAFYDSLRKGTLPTTAGLSAAKYIEIFEPAFKKGGEILYPHFSAAMTVTFNAMHQAIDELKAKYPGVRFEEIDLKAITIGAYVSLLEILQMAKDGKSIDEILAWAKEEIDHFACYFFVDDLRFFAHSGRVSHFSGFMGNLIGIKPIIQINDEGKMDSIGKVTGRKNALKALVKYVEDLGDDIKNHPFVLGDTDAPELANIVERMLREKFGDDLKIVRCYCNPTAGSHSGPDGVGVAFHAKHR